MLQHDLKLRGVAEVAPAACYRDVVAHHHVNCPSSVGAMHEVAPELGGDHFRQVLVLGDRVDLFKCKVAERDTVFQRQHGETLLKPMRSNHDGSDPGQSDPATVASGGHDGTLPSLTPLPRIAQPSCASVRPLCQPASRCYMRRTWPPGQ